MKIRLIIFLLLIVAYNTAFSQKTDSQNEKKAFIYVLKLTPKYFDEKNWKEEDTQAVQEHFLRFQNMLKEGTLVLAGRTESELKNTFGIAIYYASGIDEAKKIANEDPAVMAGIMTAEVFPFNIALVK